MIGRLGEVTATRSLDVPRERFIGVTVVPSTQLLDHHHGRPLAGLDSTWTAPDGTIYGRFTAHRGAEAEIRSLAASTPTLSVEFSGGRREVRDHWGGLCLTILGAEVDALAFDANPARDDARIIRVSDDAVQVRSAGADLRDDPRIRARYGSGRTVYGAPYRTKITVR